MTWAGTVTMSARVLDRLEVLGSVAERRLSQRRAAEQLGLGERRVRRLGRALGEQGAPGSSRASADGRATASSR